MTWPTGSMTAYLMTEPHRIEAQNVPIPAEQSTHVLVKVSYLGVCGSDVELLHGNSYYITEGLNSYPLLFGHEMTGVVAAVGDNVTDYAPGDRVLGISLVTCGHCTMCRRGRRNLCTIRAEIGLQGLDGAAAEYISLPPNALTHVPDDLPLAAATLVEPSVVVAHALRRLRVDYSDRVAVVGTGTLGLVGVQMASKIARTTHAIGVEEAGLALAKELGADEALHPDDVESNAYDVILEFSGAAPTYRWLPRGAALGARIGLGGIVNTEVQGFNPAEVSLKDLEVHGLFDGIDDYDRMLSAFSDNLVDPNTLIDRILPATQIREAFRLMEDRELTRPKVIVEFAGDTTTTTPPLNRG